jgi:chromosome segregation ATPase
MSRLFYFCLKVGGEMDILEALKIYGSIGAGGFAVIILGVSYYKHVTKYIEEMKPALEGLEKAVNQIEIENSASREVVRNNTEAIREVSKSNENVATALGLLRHSLDALIKIMERHDLRAEKIDDNIGKVRSDLSLIKQTLEIKKEVKS